MKRIGQKNSILVTGPPLIKRVDAEMAIKVHSKGIETLYYVPKGIIGCNDSCLRIEKAPANLFMRIVKFFFVLRKYHPDHVEIYVGNPYFMLPFYALITRLLKFKLVFWGRGAGIFYWDSMSNYRRVVIWFSFKLANYFIVKEAYIPDRLKKLRLATPEQILWLPNKIPFHSEYKIEREHRNVLFLNSPKRWRHIELLAKAIPSVIENVPEARFWFIGSRTDEELEYVDLEMKKTGARRWVEIRPYEADVQKFYEQAALFVLPADLIFVNHSLLEAMERGVPPLVANVDPNASKIVDHKVSGMILPLDPEVWANSIVELLKDEPRRRLMGMNARQKIFRDFNFEDKINDLVNLYQSRIWHR
jgi:glycosyltransferase involved in cell wall biosynthesis